MSSIADIFIKEAIKTESCNFVEIAERLSQPRTIRLLHASAGMVDEAAEFLAAVRKYIFYGKDLDIVNISEELGDSNWFQAIAHDELGSSFEEVMVKVIQKLRKRYHEAGFNESDAVTRDLSAERTELEKKIDLATGFGMGASKLAQVILEEGNPNKEKTGAPTHYSHSGAYTACNLQVNTANHTNFVSRVTCEDCLRAIKVNYSNPDEEDNH